MTASHSQFVGSIPEYYDHYLGPLIFDEYAADLARRVIVPPTGVVLETAAGTGIATRHLRNNLPYGVRLVVTDLNEPMLAFAVRKFGSHTNMGFLVADAAQLGFASASFDAVVCQFSLMFFSDKVSAVREVSRVLKPHGAFVLSLWESYEHNDLIRTVTETLVRLFPARPPSFFDTPYRSNQLHEANTLLAEAGFVDIETSILPRASRAETARHVALGYILGTPVCIQVAQLGGPSVEEVVNIVEQDLRETYGPGPIRAKMQAIITVAHWRALS